MLSDHARHHHSRSTTEERASAPASGHRSRTILVIDDESLARQTLTDLLEAKGYRVITLARGEEIFGWLADVDLVLLDAMLPGRDGWSICREIKDEHDPTLPVIMVTARTAPEDVVRTFDAGADDYIPKPFQVAELTARIESRLRAHDAERALKRANRQLAELADQNYQLYEQARRDAEERAHLLRELDHRVRNSLSVIMGLVSIERNRHPPRRSSRALASLENRLRSFLLVHESLRGQGYRGIPIREIAERMVQRLRNTMGLSERVRLEVRGAGCVLNERQGFAFALALNELVTNAFQHGFPDDRRGAILVHLAEQDGAVHVDVEDDGVGMNGADGETALGSGRSIVRALVHKELGGRVSYDPAAQGTRVRVTFPRENVSAPSDAPDTARSPSREPESYSHATRAPSPR